MQTVAQEASGVCQQEQAFSDSILQELSEVRQDWPVVAGLLPGQWRTKARELGAVRRQLRGFDSIDTLLRVLLIHLAEGCSLRETAARAQAAGLSQVSDIALFKRLRQCGPWFQWMTQQLSAPMALPVRDEGPLRGRRVRLIDGSTVCEPGATGSTWRLHYSLNLSTLLCEEVHLSSADEGERLERFEVRAGDIVMADRGFARRRDLRHVLGRGADVVLRTNLTNLPLQTPEGNALKLLPLLRTLTVGQAGDWPAQAVDEQGAMALRVCAYRKTAQQTRRAVQAIEREAAKKGRKVKPETLEAAAYVIVLTTLRQIDAPAVMELYRQRWQVELAFKRLKSLLQLGHLKKTDEKGARSWLQGKILVACLIETLIFTAERFSPWGYGGHEA